MKIPIGWRPSLFAVLLIAGIGIEGPRARAQTAAAEYSPLTLAETLLDDAGLADVCFVDRATGWAVGDRGVIWHSRDGGATWRRQTSPVDCSLNGVYFLDAARGWAVGGQCKPYSTTTSGVVLRTSDGGATWTRVPNLLLPTLRGVRFFDARRGIAFGETAAMFTSGVFATQDGGQTWQPLPCEGTGPWLAGDFLDPAAGAVAGPNGRFATIAQRRVINSPLATSSPRSYRAMRLIAPTGGWIVGDGGLVATTDDLGRSWRTPPAAPADGAAANFDFCAVAVHGEHVWVAGSPGSRVFHTADGGQTWSAHATGQTTPIRALTFVDGEHGWAVGELGVILATDDGGRTWHEQRSGGRRAALLAVFARPQDVPLELIAQHGAEEGYLTSIETLFQPTGHAQTRAAMLLSGATSAETAWQFALPPDDLALTPADLLAALDRANDGRAMERLLGRVVRQIRTWRPEVIVTHHAAGAANESLASFVHQLTLRAVDAAADPTQFVELAATGLEAWQVKRVYGLLPPGIQGSLRVSTGEFSPQLGTTLAGWCAPARRLIASNHAPPPDLWELDLLRSRAEDRDGPLGLFRGIPMRPGGEARRRSAIPAAGDLDELRRMAARKRHLDELLQQTEGNAAWAAQIVQLIEGMTGADGGELIFQLAEGYRTTGRTDLAAETYSLLARRMPAHPLTEPALRWLVQYYASDEAGSQSLDGGLSHDERLRRAVEIGQYVEGAQPLLFAEPAVRFPLVVAQRQLGFGDPAKRYFLTLRSQPESDPWRRCALAEEWLNEPGEQPPPKRLAHCRPTGQRPYLDGRLDETFWQSTDVLKLSDDPEANDERRATSSEQRGANIEHPIPGVRLAYDDQFLYLAVHCPKAPESEYTHEDAPRPRDPELVAHDRVALRLDVDRDYTTHFELTVDHRGWTGEACLGDSSWDPDWYVAAAEDETTWTVEAAIPLGELVRDRPAPRYVWAVAARRTIPRKGYESWAGDPADDTSPDQYGLLIFD